MKLCFLIVITLLLAACGKKPATVTQTVEIPTATPPTVHATATPQPTPPVVLYRLVGVELRPEWIAKLDRIIEGIVRNKDRYVAIQDMRAGGMPWHLVAGIHERESSRNFTRHLHEGSPLINRTYYIPRGRLPAPKKPPFTWEESSEDALYVLKREDKVDWNDTGKALDAIEAYNGWGYRDYHPDVKSPYLWSGSVRYSRGKYIADGRFDKLAVDKQPGIAAIWARMEQRGLLE